MGKYDFIEFFFKVFSISLIKLKSVTFFPEETFKILYGAELLLGSGYFLLKDLLNLGILIIV